MKKGILIGLMIMLWLGSVTVAFAETANLVFGEALPGYELEVEHPVEGRIIYQQPFKWLNNRIAWCLQMYVWTIDGTAYETSPPFDYLDEDLIRDLELIVHTAWTLTPQHYEDYFVTTLLLWERLGYSFSPTFAGSDRPNPAGLQFYSYPERRAELFSLVEQYKRVSALAGETFELAVGETIVLDDEAGVLATLLDQTAPLEHTAFERRGNQIVITGRSPGRDQYVFNRFADEHLGTTLYWHSPEGYQDIATLEISHPMETRFEVLVREPKGEVEIIKRGIDHLPLAGVSFRLLDDSDQTVAEGITDDEGRLSFTDLSYGTYRLEEMATVPGYILPEEMITLSIEQSEPLRLEIDNQAIEVEISKTDPAGNHLAGAGLQLFDPAGGLVAEWISSGEAKQWRGLAPGRYRLIETDAPEGYQPAEAMTIEVAPVRDKQRFRLINQPGEGRIRLIKTDSVTGQPLAGCVIEIYRLDDSLAAVGETADNGRLDIAGLSVGSYYYVEKQAPPGYVSDPATYPFAISRHDETICLRLENKPIRAQPVLLKQDLSSEAPIPGAVIELYHESGRLIETVTTGRDGVAEFSPLGYGRYYFLEKSAPAGYLLNPDKHWFEVRNDGQIIRSRMSNQLIRGRLELIKVCAETGRPLTGAEFEIYRAGECLGRYRTDQAGRIDLALDYGEYQIVEVAAPKGYQKADTSWPVIIEQPDQVVALKLENNRLPASLPKTGAGTSRVMLILPGLLVAAGLALQRR